MAALPPDPRHVSGPSHHGNFTSQRARQSSRSRRVVGRYQFTKTIGAGSMGKVKLAVDLTTGEKVAVKIMPRQESDESLRTATVPIPTTTPPCSPHVQDHNMSAPVEHKDVRILREIAIMKLLNHPYIVSLKDVIVHPHHYYVVLEYVSGGQLLDYIISHGRLKEKHARKFARQIASALDYCHRNSVVHRDLKIENILISSSATIKIIDFGLSNLFSTRCQLSTFCGSLYFAAPELLSAKAYTGPEVDIWSFGIVLYVLVCGKVPFDDQSMPALHAKIKRGHVEYPNWLSHECKNLLSRILVTNPEERATMAEVLRHPWMVKGYDGPVENYLSPRAPLTLPVDPHIVREMSGYGFGSTNELHAKLEGLLRSEWYHQQLQRLYPDLPATEFPGAADADPLSAPTTPMGSSFLLGTSVTRSAENMALAAREALKKRTSFWRRADPIPVDEVAMDPLISMYFLVLEKVRNESHSLISGTSTLDQSSKVITSSNHTALSPPLGQTTVASPGEAHLSMPPNVAMARPTSSPGQLAHVPTATSASSHIQRPVSHHPVGPVQDLKAVDSLVSMDDKPADSRPSHRTKPNALAAAEGVLRRISRVIRPHLGKTRTRPAEEREASGLSTSLPQPRMSTNIPFDGVTATPGDYVVVDSPHSDRAQGLSTLSDGSGERPESKSPKAIKKDSKARRISALLTNKLSNTLGSSPSAPTNDALGLQANSVDTATKEYLPDRSDVPEQMEQNVTLPCDRIPEGTTPVTDTPEGDSFLQDNSSSTRTAATLGRRISSLLTRTGSAKDRSRSPQVTSPNAKMATSSPLGFAHRLHSPSLRLRPPFQKFGSGQTPSDSFPPAYRLGQVRNSQSTSDCVGSSGKNSARSGSQLRVVNHSAVVSHGKGGLASEVGGEDDGQTGGQILHHRRLVSVAQMTSPGGPRTRTSTDPHLHEMGSSQFQQPMSASMVATMRNEPDGKGALSYSFDLAPSHPVSTATVPHRSLSSRLARKSRDSSQILTRAKKTQHLVDPATAADAVAVLERQKSTLSERADQGIRPVFLKGLFSVATTTTKSPHVIRTNIARVLDKYHVKFREGKGCFECIVTQFPLSTVAPISASKKDSKDPAGSPSLSLNDNRGMSQRTPSGDSNQSQPGRLALKSPAPSLGTRDSEGSTLPLLGRTPPGLTSPPPNSVDAPVSPHPGIRTLPGVAPLITHPNSVPMYTASNSILFFDDDDRLSSLSMSTIPLPSHRLGLNGNPSQLTTKDPAAGLQDTTTISPGVPRNAEGERSRDPNGGTDHRPGVRWDHTLIPGANIPGKGTEIAEGSVETLSTGLGRTISSPPLDTKPENVVAGDGTIRREPAWSSGTPPRPRSQLVPSSMGAIQEENAKVTAGNEQRPSTEEATPTSVKESVDVAELQHRCASLQLRTATSGELTGGASPQAISGTSYESQRPRLPLATTPQSLDSLPPSTLEPPSEPWDNPPGTVGTTNGSTWTFVRFEIAIVKVPWLRGVYGIRFRQVVGPMWQYKHLCSFILKELRL